MRLARATGFVLHPTLGRAPSPGRKDFVTRAVMPNPVFNASAFAEINGTRLAYLTAGAGVPVVFVHGAVTDHRFWAGQVAELATRFRCVCPDLRYFGQSAGGPLPYSLETHAADLSAFIRYLDLGPVHVVATSYGAAIALASAAATPERFASLFLNEPTLSSLVTEPEAIAQMSNARRELGAVVAALSAGDDKRAVELFCDWTAFPGAFEAIPGELQAVFHDNASTIRLLLAAPPPATSPTDLAPLKMPITFTTGERTKPFFRVQVLAAHRAIAHSRLVFFAQSHHASCFEQLHDFNRAIVEHISRVGIAA